MKAKKLVLDGLLLSIGFILHQISPPIFFGLKPDFLLVMMFIAIILNSDYKNVIIISLAAGIITALTTTFPAGQIPNLVDKIVTGNIVFILCRILSRFKGIIKVMLISLIGTLVSGTVFILTALLISSIEVKFIYGLFSIIGVTAVINSIMTYLIYNTIFRRIRVKEVQ